MGFRDYHRTFRRVLCHTLHLCRMGVSSGRYSHVAAQDLEKKNRVLELHSLVWPNGGRSNGKELISLSCPWSSRVSPPGSLSARLMSESCNAKSFLGGILFATLVSGHQKRFTINEWCIFPWYCRSSDLCCSSFWIFGYVPFVARSCVYTELTLSSLKIWVLHTMGYWWKPLLNSLWRPSQHIKRVLRPWSIHWLPSSVWSGTWMHDATTAHGCANECTTKPVIRRYSPSCVHSVFWRCSDPRTCADHLLQLARSCTEGVCSKHQCRIRYQHWSYEFERGDSAGRLEWSFVSLQ